MADTSIILLHALEQGHGRNARIYLIDGTQHQGEIVGYFKSDGLIGASYIYKWHIIPPGSDSPTGLNFWGVPEGVYILHKYIQRVVFVDDAFELDLSHTK
jgi:hypothetical protein